MIFVDVVGNDIHAEGTGNFSDLFANATATENTQGFTGEEGACESIPLALAHAFVGFDKAASQANQQTKTTNVNILLNRVRLDKKKTFRKRLINSIIIISLISLLTAYLIL